MNTLASFASAGAKSSESFASSSMVARIECEVLEALHALLGADAGQLYEAHGRSLHRLVGAARDASLPGCEPLLCGLRLARALLVEEMLSGETFGSPKAVADYLKLHFAGQGHESFAVLFLNAQHGLIAFEDLFRGTLTQTSVYPREVLRRALRHNAAAVILAHNHPSGMVEPSRADLALTAALKDALAFIDVRVLDHVVVAGSCTVSMAERGLV